MINTRKKSHFYGALIIEHDKNSANAAHVAYGKTDGDS